MGGEPEAADGKTTAHRDTPFGQTRLVTYTITIDPRRFALRVALIFLAFAAMAAINVGVAAVLYFGMDQLWGLAGVACSFSIVAVAARVERMGS